MNIVQQCPKAQRQHQLAMFRSWKPHVSCFSKLFSLTISSTANHNISCNSNWLLAVKVVCIIIWITIPQLSQLKISTTTTTTRWDDSSRTWCGEVAVEISSCAAVNSSAEQTVSWLSQHDDCQSLRRPAALSPPKYDRCCPCTTSPACWLRLPYSHVPSLNNK